MAAKKKAKGFTPTPAPVAPAGTYDPGLDAANRANQRGIFDLQQDTETANQRASTAYQTGLQQSQTQRGWSLADLLQGRDRGTQDLTRGRDRGKVDLATALSRSREDTGLAKADVSRGYRELGDQQTARSAGGAFVDTSSIAASAGKRTENEGRDQAGLDRGQSRFESDNTLAGSRLDEDYSTGIGRLNEDYTTGVGRTNQSFDWNDAGLATDYQYGVDDRGMGVARALREGNFFNQDTQAAKMQQATQSGLYSPPAKPKNEFSDGKGPYQVVLKNGLRYKMRPNGKLEPAGVAGGK